MEPVKIGDAVVYVDENSRERAAIVTNLYNENRGANLVIVSDDDAKQDTYGRQIERRTSVPHVSVNHAPGNFWKRVGE